MLRHTLLALACVASLACSASVSLPPATVSADAAVPQPQAKPHSHFEQLAFAAASRLLPGTADTLFFLERTPDGVDVDELDARSLRVSRTLHVTERGTYSAWARSSSSIYLLFSRDATHRLVAIDATTLEVVADSVTPGAMLTGARGNPEVQPGTRGVRIVFLKGCKEDLEGLCWAYETHALGTLALTKTRGHTFARGWSTKLPPLHVPDDQGADDAYRGADPAGWAYDADKHALVATDGRFVDFPIHGTAIGNVLVVGRRAFVVTSGCCGGPRGGFYVRDLPE